MLLLEAGGEETPWSYRVPVFRGLATEDEEMRLDHYVRHYADEARQEKDRSIWWSGRPAGVNKLLDASSELTLHPEVMSGVDASVFPRIPGFFVVMPIYMIAEKAAEAILADARA